MNVHLRTELQMRTALSIVATSCALSCFLPYSLSADFPQPTNTEKSASNPLTPDEVCKTTKLPAGFKLTTFASEPDVQNPMQITTDDRGRVWVAENYTWAGADAGDFDKNLKDRVTILGDVDGDGKFDKRTVFFDQAERLTSLQVGLGGVWLLCPPQLLFVPDKNRDDVPDGPSQVVLDGFDIKTSTHTVANGLKWGPDGWLYGRQGILGTSKIGVPGADEAQRVTMNTGIWRYHPTRHVVEVAMHGMTNPWGFDYDAFGEIFVTNTVIGHLWHVIPGARTERMSGSDINPHAYQLMSQVADHVHWSSTETWTDVRKEVTGSTSAAGGGHAHTGLMIYQGDNWPAEYRGRAYMVNIHGQRLNCDILKRKDVGYVASHGPDMCFVADPWFRGMDVISGADGGVFIPDWSDTGECHEMGGVHRTSGRIYKLTYGNPESNGKTDLGHATDEQLVQLQTNANDWFSRQARLVLQERAATGSLNTTACRTALLQLFRENSDPVIRVRAFWSLYLSGCVDEAWLISQLQHPDEHVRVWAVRFLSDAHGVDDLAGWTPVLKEFYSMASEDSSGLVLLYLASAMQKIPVESRWQLGQAIARRPEVAFADDRTLSVMLWLGIEPFVAQHPDKALELMRETTFSVIREDIARRLTSEIDHDIASVEKLLMLAADDDQLSADIIRGAAASLNGRKAPPVPANWSEASKKLLATGNHDLDDSLSTIGIAFKDSRAIESLRHTVENSGAKPESRVRALQLLLTAHPKDLDTVLRRLVKDRDLALEAIRGLAAYDDQESPATLLENYEHLTSEQRAAAINTLASRAKYAHALLQALESKKLQPNDISPFQARQIMSLGDSSINDRLRALWGDARQTSEEKRQAIDTLRAVLIPTLAQADAGNGKAVFTKSCATCHTLFGQGAKIGPDLTGSNRKNLDYLLENMVDPSAIVAAEFRATVFVLSDGHVLTGIVREKNDKTITIETPESKQVIDRQLVDETSVSEKSLMPDGLLQVLTDAQIRDLIAYLQSN